MQAYPAVIPHARTGNALLWAAWISMLLVSDIPNIVWNFFAPEPYWLIWIKVSVLAGFLLLAVVSYVLRPLWKFFAILLALSLALQASTALGGAGWWQARFGGEQAGFANGFAGIQMRELLVAAFLVLLLGLMLRRRDAFFLAGGQLDAPLKPVRWLGIGQGESWKKFGPIFAACMFGGGLVVAALSALPLLPKISQVMPLLPFVVLFSAINALGEELTFRAPLLGTLHEVIDDRHALLLTTVFFGSLHYLYGMPSGVFGFLLTGFVAYLFGKSMLETGGMFWAWFMHFVADIPIFILIALFMV
jgi:membrane protease YdiL (CAAX protease family)